MIIEHQSAVALPIEEAFQRLRCFAKAYPEFHPAHRKHPPSAQPPLLEEGSSFRVSEHLGLEERRYAFKVTRYEAPTRLFMTADVATRVAGLFVLRSSLVLEFRLREASGGTQIESTQRVSLPGGRFGAPLMALLFGRGIREHANEETARAIAVLVDMPLPNDEEA